MNIISMQIMTVLGARFGVASAITLTRWDAETRLPIGQSSFPEILLAVTAHYPSLKKCGE